MDIDNRVKYYLGNGLEEEKWNITFNENDESCTFIQNGVKNIYFTICCEQYGTYCINKYFTIDKYIELFSSKCNKLNDNHPAKKNFKSICDYNIQGYINQMIDLFNSDKYFYNYNFIVRPGDVFFNTPVPIITKTRPIGKSFNILINLDKERHWNELKNINKYDIPFQEKNNKIIWRGAPNGLIVQELYNRPSRRLLVKNYWNHPNNMIDIGFIYNFEETNGKGHLSIQKQLESKFLISVEGGDVATGLKWMMYSNSIVLMPKPTMCSWFMEDMLIPYIHYVPLENDFSDIEEKYNWCLANLDKCEEIVNNSKSYVEQFLDEDREKLITKLVLKKYTDSVIVSLF